MSSGRSEQAEVANLDPLSDGKKREYLAKCEIGLQGNEIAGIDLI